MLEKQDEERSHLQLGFSLCVNEVRPFSTDLGASEYFGNSHYIFLCSIDVLLV